MEELRRHARTPAGVAVLLYAAVSLAMLVTTSPERLRSHTPFNHFALLAHGWLDGRLDLGGPPPDYALNNDFAVHDGKYYVTFPPVPAVLLLPAAAIAERPEQIRDGRVFLAFAGIGPSFLYLALEKLSRTGRSRRRFAENIALAALLAVGTVFWFTAVQGTVWFAAHVVGVAFACMYAFASLDAEHPIVAGLALGLALGSRTPLAFALPLFVLEAWRTLRADRSRLVRTMLRFAAPLSLVAAALCWHNIARFGDPFDFGHRWLAIGWRGRIDKWGLFSYHYLGRNLAVVLTSLPWLPGATTPFQINVHGLALWITSPFYAWALWPRRTPPIYWALAVTALAVAAPSLLYQNSGWEQFGYRFSNDFAPFVILMIAVGQRRLGAAFWALAAVAVAVNAFGALTFQRAGYYDRYYFLDRSQRILHQPD